MRRVIQLLASTALGLLLGCGVALAQAADTTPPDTFVDYGPRTDGRPYDKETSSTLKFSSDEDGVTFECKIDDSAFEACTTPSPTTP